MRTITTELRPMPQARAMRERSAAAARIAFYGAVALIAAITLGMPFTHPF